MYKLLIIFILIIGQIICSEQTIENLIFTGDANNDIGYKIIVDESGNFYVTGSFEGTVDFDPSGGVSNKTSNGSTDIFIVKYNSNGDLVWIQSIGGGNGDEPTDLDFDLNGDLILTGYFNGIVDFDPTAGVSNETATNNGGFFAKYDDSDGSLIWVSSIGSSQNDEVSAMDIDANGNIYITGFMGDDAEFDPGVGSTVLTSGGGRDTYIAKYDNNGDLLWANMMGGVSQEKGDDIKLDSEGNVYISGNYLDDFDIDPGVGTTTLSHTASSDIYLAKFDNSGNFVWAKTLSDAGSVSVAALDFDDDENIYLTGEFYNTVDFDPSASVNNKISSGNSDIYILKLDNSGNFIWVNTFGNTGNDIPSELYYDGNGSIYIAGQFTGTVDFDPSADVNQLMSNGGVDGLIARYNTDGEYKDAIGFGNFGNENAYAIVSDDDRTIYITGAYVSTVDFDPGAGTTNASSNGGFEYFAVVYSQILEPIVTTNSISSLSTNSVTSGGVITDNGNSAITQSGLVWSTDPNPTIASTNGGGITNEGSNSAFQTTITGLLENTTYYLRAYATNSIGTSYGNQITFNTQISISNDGNQDGILDINQNNVVTILSEDGISYITVESGAGTTLSDVRLFDYNDNNYVYPFGMVEFKLNVSNADVDIIFHGASNVSSYVYRKIYSNSSYNDFQNIEWLTRTINGEVVNVARLSLSDGGDGDFDGEVNGIIYDPGGPAIPISANIPYWSWWHLVVFFSVLGIWFWRIK